MRCPWHHKIVGAVAIWGVAIVLALLFCIMAGIPFAFR